MQEFLNNKISKISIDEEKNNVVYYMSNGDAIRTKLSTIIENKKKIYKNFRITQKCHELTTSGFKRRKLQKNLNPAIIKGLNDNVEIMEYIRCVKAKSKLPFELEHNTANSILNFTNRRKMKNIAKNERKLGAKVNIVNENFLNTIKKKIKDIGSSIFNEDTSSDKKKRDTSVLSEGEIDKRCEDVKQYLIKYYQNMSVNIENISELESIELKLKTAISWYIDNKKNKKADTNIRIYRNLLENEREYFYLPQYHETYKQNPKEAILKFKEPLYIKHYELRKLQIRNLLLRGNQERAENLYKKTLNDLGIKLTKKEMKMSLKEGINTGSYYVLENRMFYRKRINGNEGILAEIKNIDEVSNQQNEIKKNQWSTLEENKRNKETEHSQEKIYSKEEITSVMKKWDNFSEKIKFQKGAVIPVVDELISYLKTNKDNNIKEYLDKILTYINKVEPIDMINEKEGRNNKYNVLIFDYLCNLYRNGVKGINDEDIVKKDSKINSYYMYILNRRINNGDENRLLLGEKKIDKIKNEYFKNSELIEFEYFEEIKKKHNKQVHGIKDKLINEKNTWMQFMILKIMQIMTA